MSQRLTCKYTVYSDFYLPEGVKLLSVEENEQGKPFSWYINCNTLYYLNEKGEEVEIEGSTTDVKEQMNQPDDDSVEFVGIPSTSEKN